MRVLIDTNVLISAALSANGVPYRAYVKAASYPNHGLICEQNVDEMKRIFNKKFRFHCQFRCHRCAIGIADDFTAAQIHDRLQISPSFFLHMDAGNICAPFLIDGFRSKITFQDIHFIIWDTAMIGMVAVLLYYHRAQSLPCHMPLDPLDAAGCPNAIEYTA